MSAAKGVSVEQALYDDLTGTVGLSPRQAAGVLGNAQVESGFDPTALNAREGAIGLFQWEKGRRSALDAYASAHHLAETDPAAQIGYLNTELAGPYAQVVADIRGTSDPATAARLWDVGPGGVNSGTGFENSSGSTTGERMADAQSIYAQLAAGQPLTAGATTSATLTGSAGGSSGAQGAFGGPLNPANWGSEFATAVVPWIVRIAAGLAGATLVIVGLAHTSGGQKARGTVAELVGSATP